MMQKQYWQWRRARFPNSFYVPIAMKSTMTSTKGESSIPVAIQDALPVYAKTVCALSAPVSMTFMIRFYILKWQWLLDGFFDTVIYSYFLSCYTLYHTYMRAIFLNRIK